MKPVETLNWLLNNSASASALRWFRVGVLLLAFGLAAGAQTQPPAERPGGPAGAQTQSPAEQPGGPESLGLPQTAGQAPIFRSGVTLVTTDVIPRDSNGLFIPDLSKEEITVYEDDQPQEIASLVLVHGGRVYNQLLPPPPVQEGIVLPPSRPVNDTAGRIFVIFVDDLHLSTSLTPKTRQVFETIIDELIHEGDMFGIVSSGPSAINVQMTYDRSLLYSAMGRITGDGFSNQDMIVQLSGGPGGPTELRWRAHKAFKLARDIVRNLEHVENRRKVFIYLSSGYDFNPFEYERFRNSAVGQAMNDVQQAMGSGNDAFYRGVTDRDIDMFNVNERQGTVFADTDLAMEVKQLTLAANRANASFYTIDPRGLVAGPDLEYDVPLREWRDHVFQTQNSLRLLAELTGGMAVVNRNDFDDALREIDAETSDYYVLGFYSSNPDPTFRTRRLRVAVDREGVNLRHRTHYSFPATQEETVIP